MASRSRTRNRQIVRQRRKRIHLPQRSTRCRQIHPVPRCRCMGNRQEPCHPCTHRLRKPKPSQNVLPPNPRNLRTPQPNACRPRVSQERFSARRSRMPLYRLWAFQTSRQRRALACRRIYRRTTRRQRARQQRTNRTRIWYRRRIHRTPCRPLPL